MTLAMISLILSCLVKEMSLQKHSNGISMYFVSLCTLETLTKYCQFHILCTIGLYMAKCSGVHNISIS
jgi:hypothetical protein